MRACLVGLVLLGCTGEPVREARDDAKVYVAVEHDEAIVVLDAGTLKLRRTIVAGHHAHVHNVQVAPDARSVWATIVSAHDDGADDHEAGPEEPDRVIVIDPVTDTITATIYLGIAVHPAHVVLTPDSRTALVTAAGTNELIRIDAATRTVTGRFPLGANTDPHGVRLSRDGRYAWVAKLGGCLVRVDLTSGETEHTVLDGSAVQSAVAGRFVFASLYSTRKIARVDSFTGELRYVALPAAAQGPIQLYPTPDGRTILVADQGGLEGRAWSNRLFFIDVEKASVEDEVTVGNGAHGVAISGARAFVTGIEDGTVTAIDLTTHTVVASTKVGRAPNGISVWNEPR